MSEKLRTLAFAPNEIALLKFTPLEYVSTYFTILALSRPYAHGRLARQFTITNITSTNVLRTKDLPSEVGTAEACDQTTFRMASSFSRPLIVLGAILLAHAYVISSSSRLPRLAPMSADSSQNSQMLFSL